MKTLDEVIEYFNHQCKMRHVYLTEDAGARFADALHYLKKYREEDKELGRALNDACNAEAEYNRLVEDLERNDPLTWDELKTMEGKPVWVEEIEDDKILFGQWDIISGFSYSENFDLINYENPIIDFYKSGNRTKFGLGKTWQAYRKERK